MKIARAIQRIKALKLFTHIEDFFLILIVRDGEDFALKVQMLLVHQLTDVAINRVGAVAVDYITVDKIALNVYLILVDNLRADRNFHSSAPPNIPSQQVGQMPVISISRSFAER